jgi:hypothetical protein
LQPKRKRGGEVESGHCDCLTVASEWIQDSETPRFCDDENASGCFFAKASWNSEVRYDLQGNTAILLLEKVKRNYII